MPTLGIIRNLKIHILTQLRLELLRVQLLLYNTRVQIYRLGVYSKHLHLLQYRRGHNIVCCLLFVQHLVYSIWIGKSGLQLRSWRHADDGDHQEFEYTCSHAAASRAV